MNVHVVIREGWGGAGRRGRALGDPVLVGGVWWLMVVWDGEEDPDCFKAAGLVVDAPLATPEVVLVRWRRLVQLGLAGQRTSVLGITT